SPAGLPSLASLRGAPSPAMRPAMRERGLDSGLYRVLTWFSPGFPVGAFSFAWPRSRCRARLVHDRETLRRWIAGVLACGTGRMDADTLREAHRAANAQDLEALSTSKPAAARIPR